MAEEAKVEELAFIFDVPDVPTDTVMQVQAPDGVSLQIKKQASVQSGDKLHMVRSADGKWNLKHIVRGTAAPKPLPVSASGDRMKTPEQLQHDLDGPTAVNVKMATSKGDIVLQIVVWWAPLGAQRFMQLVTDGYYTGLPIYRAVPDFLIQFGVGKDLDPDEKYNALQDDPLAGVPVQEGMVCFAAAGPDTRKSTICIFLTDIPDLGKNPWETPIGRVHPDSMKILKEIYTGYGDMPQCGGTGPDPIELEDKGNDYITENFPKTDFVEAMTWM